MRVVGVAISRSPSMAHWSRDAISSVLRDSSMGSKRVGLAILGVDAGASGCVSTASD